MAKLHISWVTLASPGDGNAAGALRRLVGSETLTTSGASAPSTGSCPDGATHALVGCVDSAHLVSFGASAPTVSAAMGLFVPSGGVELIPVNEGDKIAAMTIS